MKPWKFLPKLRGGDEVPSENAVRDQAHSEQSVSDASKVEADEAVEDTAEEAGLEGGLAARAGSKVVTDEAVDVCAEESGLKGIGHVSQR